MKKISVILTMLLSSVSIAQSPGWTNLKETNINVGSNNYDIFTNGAGNHIIEQETSFLKYYRMKVDGSYDIGPTNMEISAVVSPSISGDLNRIYVVYRKASENFIRTKYSTNGGSSWSYLASNPSNSNAASIECEFSEGNLHVTYQIGNVVYYNYYNTLTNNWLITPTSV